MAQDAEGSLGCRRPDLRDRLTGLGALSVSSQDWGPQKGLVERGLRGKSPWSGDNGWAEL